MLKRAVAILLCILLAALLLVSCKPQEEEASGEIREIDDKIKIGMTFDTFVLERWTKDRDVFVSTAQKLGAEVDVQNANGDVEKQIQQIERFVNEGVDTIVIVAVDCYAMAEAVTMARNQGIEVVSYDRMIQGVLTDLYITTDSEQVGQAMAQELKNRLPGGGNIVMVCGPEADTNSQDVTNGFEKEIADSNLNVVSKTSVKAWVPEYGFQAVNEAFENIQEIDAVMCGNDGLAGNAIKALSEQQLAGKVIVVGQDADLEACQRIVEGTQSMTVYKPIEDMARMAAEYSIRLAKGEKLTKVTERKKNDVGEVPYCGLLPVPVTAENMDEVIIKPGFHLKDEVYLNVE